MLVVFTAKGCRRIGQFHVQIVAIALGIDFFGLIVIQREAPPVSSRSPFRTGSALVYLPFSGIWSRRYPDFGLYRSRWCYRKILRRPLRESPLSQSSRRLAGLAHGVVTSFGGCPVVVSRGVGADPPVKF